MSLQSRLGEDALIDATLLALVAWGAIFPSCCCPGLQVRYVLAMHCVTSNDWVKGRAGWKIYIHVHQDRLLHSKEYPSLGPAHHSDPLHVFQATMSLQTDFGD